MGVVDSIRRLRAALSDARGLWQLQHALAAEREGVHQAAVEAYSEALRLLDDDRPQRAGIRRGLVCARHALRHGDGPSLMREICVTPLERHAMLHSMDAHYLAARPEKDLLLPCLLVHLAADDWLSLPPERRVADRVLRGILEDLDGDAWAVLLDELMQELPFERWLPATQWQTAPHLGSAVQEDVAARHPRTPFITR